MIENLSRCLVLAVAAVGGACVDTEPSPTPMAGVHDAGAGISEPCDASDACAAGLTCEAYYGVEGSAGPKLQTCELRCEDDTECPTGTSCVLIVDGPGRVCRA